MVAQQIQKLPLNAGVPPYLEPQLPHFQHSPLLNLRKASEDGPSAWAPGPTWQHLEEAPGLIQHWLLQPSGK